MSAILSQLAREGRLAVVDSLKLDSPKTKVLADKLDYVSEFAERGLKRKGLELLGVIPHQQILSCPTVSSIREELHARLLNEPREIHTIVEDVVVGAMGAQNATQFFRPNALIITPGDREDIILAAAADQAANGRARLAGIVLTGNLEPSAAVMRAICKLPYPVMLAEKDSYQVASKVHDLIVKTRPDDAEKIALIRDLVTRNVDVKRIVKALT